MIQKISKRSACWLLLVLLLMGGMITASAAEAENNFESSVTLLPGTEGAVYSLQVDVANHGKDFEGAVRVMVHEPYESSCAYDTAITLPQDAAKQFVLQIPKNAVSSTRVELIVSIVDLKGNIIQTETKTGIFSNISAGMPVGILSDNYSGLTYLDKGGQPYYIVNDDYPLNLVELNGDNLLNMLDGLRFLVIDQFNVSSLSEECIQEIQEWVSGGGILIIGTGAYGNETLSGFDETFIGASCDRVVYAGSNESQSFQYNENNFYEYLWMYWDPKQSDIADISYDDFNYSENYWCYGISKSEGSGSVTVLYYALSDSNFTASADFEIISQILDEAINCSSGIYNDLDVNTLNGDVEKAFQWIDSCNTAINFTALKILVVVYVILIGPVIYLILRAVRKRELYWLAVPVSAVLFIGLVYLAGRGFKVDNATVYSVAVSEASGTGDTRTFISAYNAKFGEWRLKLDGEYEAAGPADSSYYNSQNTVDYYQHITFSPEGIFFGADQNSSFESACFSAWKDNTAAGGYEYRDVEIADNFTASGIIVNRTGKLLDFVGVYDNGFMFLYRNVPPDGVIDLSKNKPYDTVPLGSYVDDFIYETVSDAYYSEKDEEASALSAMYMGLLESYDSGSLIIGVTSDYEKAVDDDCNELSFGCLYTRMAEE